MNNAQHESQASDASRILNAALELAQEQSNWYDLSLVELADRCDTSIHEIHSHFADTNAIADAWFAQALEAMLSPGLDNINHLSSKARLEQIIWRWFEALAPYQSLAAQMLKSKLHPPHIHHTSITGCP